MARRIRKWVLWGLLGLTGLAAIAGLGGTLWLRGSLPQTSGEIQLEGLAAPVEVLRDSEGLVTLRAANDLDAYRALGFVHAQERLWQMDFMRRLGSGRLSEVVGAATLGTDRFMRTLGLFRQAEAQVARLRPETKATLEAYAAGVNAFLAQRSGPLPPEFQLLRHEPAPWRPADSLVWGRIMALLLSGNWRSEVLRAKLLKRLDPAEVAFLWPGDPDDAPTTVTTAAAARLPAAPALRALLEQVPPELRPQSASNAWAVAGSLTASGKPILANDPHLSLQAPGKWFLVRIETPERTLAGATAPGVPFIVIGHNDRIAWGFTTTHSDTQDLFVERLTDDGGYETPEGPRAFEVVREVITVKDAEPVELEVRISRHGPVISDAFMDERNRPGEGHVLALAWTALREDDRTPDGLLALNRARNWTEFETALEDFHSPQQNIVYADVEGNIGFLAPGRVPLRKAGDGTAPVEGWSGAYDWTGLLPYADLPRVLNPRQGRIVSGNNRVVPDDYPHLLTAHWPPPQRARRILELLSAKTPLDPEAAAAMQMDSHAGDAAVLLPRLLGATPESPLAQNALARLRAWDYVMDRARPEPLIYAAWTIELTRLLLADDLGEDFEELARPEARRLTALLNRGGTWCDDSTTADRKESCGERITAALEAAVAGLAQDLGDDPENWRWGALHRADLAHPVLSRIPLVADLFGFGQETDGGDETVNRGVYAIDGGRRFAHVAGASLRIVYDLADLDATRAITATGQSGNPLSPHYGSFARRWRDGALLRLKNDSQEGYQRLTLAPL